MADLLLETGGYCFLCLANLNSDFLEGGHYGTTYSLQYLSRYLKLDMTKVFGGCDSLDKEKLIPPVLLAKVERSKLKAELCHECVSLSGKLSQLYRKLEKTKLEMKFYTNLIHGRLVKVLQDNSGKDAERLHTLVAGANAALIGEVKFSEKLKIVDLLRAEATVKCASKLASGVPRVKVEHMKRSLIRKHVARKVKIESSLQNDTKYENISASGSNHEDFEDYTICNVQLPQYKLDVSSNHVDESDNVNSPYDSDPDFVPNEGCQVLPVLEGLGAERDIDRKPIKRKKTKTFAITNTSSSSAIPLPAFKINPITGDYICQCSKEFTTRGYYRTHFRSMHMGVSFCCSICKRSFPFRSNLSQHWKLVHSTKKTKFKCNYCSKSFSTSSNRKAHERGYCPAKNSLGPMHP